MANYQWQINSGGWVSIPDAILFEYNATELGNYRCVATNIYGQQAISDTAAITGEWEFKFTVHVPIWSGDPTNLSITLPLLENLSHNTFVYDFTVDWGDNSTGAVTAYNSAAATHTYSRTGSYVIKIAGVCEAFCYLAEHTFGLGVISMDEMQHPARLKTFSLSGCTDLTYIDPSFNMPIGMYAFGINNLAKSCAKLAEIPEGIFDNCTHIQDFEYCFMGCTAITEIPEDLFKYNVHAVSFKHCFDDTGITSIPTDLFRYNVKAEDFSYCFYGGPDLTSIPVTLFNRCPKAVNFSNTFEGCTSLTSIPTVLFSSCPDVTSAASCFYGCTSLTAVPATLFSGCSKITDYSYCFANCMSLTGTAQGFITAAEARAASEGLTLNTLGCFVGCTGLSDYATIPRKWVYIATPVFTLEPVTYMLVAVGGTYTYYTTATEAESYQWQTRSAATSWEWVDIEGATDDSYTTPAMMVIGDNRFLCIATNAVGSTWSTEARLIVTG